MGDSGAMLLGFVLAAISVQGLLKTAATVALAFPLLVLGDPDPRHVVRRPEAAQVPAADHRGGREPPPPPLHQHRLHAAPRGADDVRLVRDARRGGAGDALHPAAAARSLAARAHARGGAIGLAALATSVYVVYVLEIVKIANPRIRRREPEARRRRSA